MRAARPLAILEKVLKNVLFISGTSRSWGWYKPENSAHVIRPENLSGHKVQNIPKKVKTPTGV